MTFTACTGNRATSLTFLHSQFYSKCTTMHKPSTTGQLCTHPHRGNMHRKQHPLCPPCALRGPSFRCAAQGMGMGMGTAVHCIAAQQSRELPFPVLTPRYRQHGMAWILAVLLFPCLLLCHLRPRAFPSGPNVLFHTQYSALTIVRSHVVMSCTTPPSHHIHPTPRLAHIPISPQPTNKKLNTSPPHTLTHLLARHHSSHYIHHHASARPSRSPRAHARGDSGGG